MARARRGAAVAAVAALLAAAVPGAASAADGHHGGAAQGQSAGAPAYYDSGLSPTPYMGWNTYYGLGAPTEAQVKSVADFLVSSGLRKAATTSCGWTAAGRPTPRATRRAVLTANRDRFPDGIPALVSYLHARGLKAGIYTDAGDYDPASCGLGSRGHYQQDADLFASWKIDAVKVDFLCGIGEKLHPGPAFQQFSDAVAASGRPMLLNLCNPLTDDWGLPHDPDQDAHNTYVYGPTTADSWRTGTDIAYGTPTAGEFANVLRNMDANAWHPEAQGPGHWNDPDYLIPTRTMPDGSYELNQEESTTQLVMWAEMALPAGRRLRPAHPVRRRCSTPWRTRRSWPWTRTRWASRACGSPPTPPVTPTARCSRARGGARWCCSTARTSPRSARSPSPRRA